MITGSAPLQPLTAMLMFISLGAAWLAPFLENGQVADPVQVEAADERGTEQVVHASDVKLVENTFNNIQQLHHFFS